MKVSTKGRYALRLLADLAAHCDCGCIALKDIAARQSISKKYLEQIVPLLNKAGLLRRQCERSAHCETLPVWQGLYDVVNNYLDGITVQDIVDSARTNGADDYVI